LKVNSTSIAQIHQDARATKH